jgi:hypothetical protein
MRRTKQHRHTSLSLTLSWSREEGAASELAGGVAHDDMTTRDLMGVLTGTHGSKVSCIIVHLNIMRSAGS